MATAQDALFDIPVKRIDGQEQSLGAYRGKVLLIVNTASKCGFTPQFEGLQGLYDRYHDKGLEILGFPCNQFMNQDPGSDDEISSFCSLNYGVSFPMFSKIDVNGPNTHPLYQFLKQQKKGMLGSEGIKWNFTKFLVGRDGNVIKRFPPTVKPESMTGDIEKALGA